MLLVGGSDGSILQDKSNGQVLTRDGGSEWLVLASKIII